MASKSGQESASTEQIEDLLDAVDKTLDRLKTLYEQYFLGIQKQAPAYIHSDVERKLRDLTQLNIRNTGLRYRLATLQQKFGSYNSYWRRTLRQIENGTYARNLAKIGREAARTGSDIPEEILAAMPKRMREQVLRDRDQAIAIAKRRQQLEAAAAAAGADDADAFVHDQTVQLDDVPIRQPGPKKTATGAHILDEDDADIDFNALFSAFEDDAPPASAARAKAPSQPPRNKPGTLQPASRPQLPRMPVPNTNTPPLGTPSAPVHATGPVPVVTPPATQTSAIPRPHVQAPSGPTQGVPRPIDQQPSPPTGAVVRPPGVVPPTSRTGPVPVAQRQTGPVPTMTQPIPRPVPSSAPAAQPPRAPSQQARPTPVVPGAAAQTGPVAVESMSGPFPRQPTEKTGQTQAVPRAATNPGQTGRTQGIPRAATTPGHTGTTAVPRAATSSGQTGQTQSIPRAATSSGQTGQTQSIPRATTSSGQTGQTQSIPLSQTQPIRTTQAIPKPGAPLKPPPGMTEADVNALHAKYVKAKEMIGEKVDAGSRDKLLKTINQTAPKIMQQYKASSVDFSVVVKDNQVVIKAKPKT